MLALIGRDATLSREDQVYLRDFATRKPDGPSK